MGGDEGVKWAPEIGDEWKFVAHEWPTDDEESAHTVCLWLGFCLVGWLAGVLDGWFVQKGVPLGWFVASFAAS